LDRLGYLSTKETVEEELIVSQTPTIVTAALPIIVADKNSMILLNHKNFK